LLDRSWEKSLGTFYVKAVVLNVVYNFFDKVKEGEPLRIGNMHLDAVITEVEKYLLTQITGKLPNLKKLAALFSISQSTLKRHFTSRYGMTMSAYFTKKKMENAQQLLQEKKTTLTETAHMVGYSNVHNFLTMYKKHYHYSTEEIASLIQQLPFAG